MTDKFIDSSARQAEPTAAEVLRQAWEAGRPIVPFLAAGVSAGSGFPVISELNRYLLKTKFYIKYGAYRESFGRPMGRDAKLTDPENRTSQFLSEYGWPNFNQLDLELDYLSRKAAVSLYHDSEKDAHKRDEVAWLDNIVGNTFKSYGENLASTEVGTNNPSTWKKYLDRTAKSPKWGRDRWRLASVCQHVLLEDIRSKDRPLAGEVQDKVWGLDLVPRSDWAQLLIDLAEGRLGLVDALLGGLGLRYRPGSSHVILAHLVKLLGIRLLLTTNFDPYIEHALEQEGTLPRVLDIIRDAKPPDAEVVKQSLAVIKLHGSAYNLGFGERLDYELDETTRAAIQQYVPENALLLVVGFSGGERRMMQLIEHLAFGGAARSVQTRDETKVIWMHHEPESGLSFPVRNFRARLRSLGQDRMLLLERLSDAGEFLLDAYQRITCTLPKSRSRYSALPKRVLPRVDRQPSGTQYESRDTSAYEKTEGQPFHLFIRHTLKSEVSTPIWTVFETGPDGRGSPSLEMSDFVAFRQAELYRPVWIDLEDHHTISGVITEIIDKLRVYDPDLPPSVGSLNPDNVFEVPMRLIRRALKRGRYVLAFDSLDSFGRRQTVHHGVPVTRENDRSPDRVPGLLQFMSRLMNLGTSFPKNDDAIDRELRTLDWYCCVACDEPIPRHLPEQGGTGLSSDELKTWSNVRKEIRKFVDRWPAPEDPGSTASTVGGTVVPRAASEVVRDLPGPSVLLDAWSDSAETPAEPSAEPRKYAVPTSVLSPIAAGPVSRERHRTYHKMPVSRTATPEKSNGRRETLEHVLRRIDEHCTQHVGAALPEKLRLQMQGVVARIVKNTLDEFRGILMKPEADLSQVAWLSELDAAYCMLAVFRRPLNFVSVQAVLSEFLPARPIAGLGSKCGAIDKTLEALRSRELLHRTKGGLYWIPHHVHAWTYKALSEPLRQSGIYEVTPQSYCKDLESGGLADRCRRLIFLILLHSRAARHYYLTVFQCSHDQNALFECFYHLISALRYAKILDFYRSYGELSADGAQILSSSEAANLDAELRPSWELLDRHEGLTAESHEAWLQRNSTVNSPEAGGDSGLRTTSALRLKLLQEVLNVLRREDETIRSTGSADTWLAWFQELRYDLPRIVVSKDDADSRMKNELVRAAWAKAGEETHLTLRHQMEWYLSALEARLYREKRDSHECIRKRIRMLEKTCVEALGEVKRRLNDGPAGTSDNANKQTTDTIESLSAEARKAFGFALAALESAFADDDSRKFLLIWNEFWKRAEEQWFPKLGSIFEAVKNADELSIIDVVFGALRDVTECLIHLTQGEYKAGLIERIQQNTEDLLDRFDIAGGPSMLSQFPNLRRKLEVLRHDLDLDKLRFHADRLDAWPARRFDAVGRIGNHRAAELGSKLLEGAISTRHRLRGAPFESGTQLAARLCQALVIEAQTLLCVERFDDAVQVLELAANGLDESVSEHRLLAARVQRRRADAAMRRTDSELRRRANPPIESARARLREADKAILESERLLSNGRRDVEEWRCLYETKAQLQIEHLLLLLSEIDSRYASLPKIHPFVAQVHGHLLVGLDAIRGALDCVADPVRAAKKPAKKHSMPLISGFMHWLQLMTTGHLALIRFAQRRGLANEHRPSRQESYVDQANELKWETEELVEIDNFSRRWTGLNRAAGLDLFVVENGVHAYPADADHPSARNVWNQVLRDLSDLTQTPLDRAAELLGLQPLSDPLFQSRELALRFAELWFTLDGKQTSKPGENHAVIKLLRAVYSPRP
jgi:hypothetical protein